jgi:hypothetical protein
LRYLQIDSKHKCVPTDWYLGYDTFATYTFLQLSQTKGYFKTLTKDTIIDYERDFHQIRGFFGYLIFKFKLIWSSFFDLFLLGSMVVVITNMLEHLVLDACKSSRNNQLVISITLVAKLLSLNTIHLLA